MIDDPQRFDAIGFEGDDGNSEKNRIRHGVSRQESEQSTKTISLRLPESLLEGLKTLANKRDVPYQSLLKIFLAERVEAELGPR